MNFSKPKSVFLKNYSKPKFYIQETHLYVDLFDDKAHVLSRLCMQRNPENKDASLMLDGEALQFISVKLNGNLLTEDQYIVSENALIIHEVGDKFELEIENTIEPQNNTQLSGLYRSSTLFCTQCEAEGFRRITYYLDRPDVLSLFTTTICADKTAYPVLLSNGNQVGAGDKDGNRHWVSWHDPFKKPCYLFALVAGDLSLLEDSYRTTSGQNIRLQIYVEKENSDKCGYAMESIKKAMHWDELRFHREYDLERYMIVAVNDFNMGAMENKGLNIFNSKYILAEPCTATDKDFMLIDAVIGHEYFHNWSGNRVTCRDWFQLSLKEGLTIFREHEFCADLTSRAVKRIEEVKFLRSEQFAEDRGPMSHPVMPDHYIEINNFYTLTIYEKGSEIIRMIQTLIGKSGFDKGLELYFDKYDGQAVTIDDFINAMEEANHKDLSQFKWWYSQSGTPLLTVTTDYNEKEKIFTLQVEQTYSPTKDQAIKKPLHIPLVIGLLDEEGHSLDFTIGSEKEKILQTTLEQKQPQETFHLYNVTKKPIPSLLRAFSAPVKLSYDYSDDQLRTLMLHDKDGFNRWEARQQLTLKLIDELMIKYQHNETITVKESLFIDFKVLLNDDKEDKLLVSELLAFPTQKYIAEYKDIIDVDGIFYVRELLMKEIAKANYKELRDCYYENQQPRDAVYDLSIDAIAGRSLSNVCLSYLAKLDNTEIHQLLWKQFESANNMTDCSNALVHLSHLDCSERIQALTDFFEKHKRNALVVDKWFSIQAMSTLKDTINTVKNLMNHPDFNWINPNRVRSILASFAMQNPVRFHAVSGEGYQLLADAIIYLDDLNPQLAARLCEPLIQGNRHLPIRRELMRKQLERISNKEKLSADTYEIVSRALE